MNTEKTICFEKMIWPIILVSLICFPILYTAAIYVYVYVIDMNNPVFFDILLGTLGRLMKGMITSANSFLPIMFLYCFFALKHKILWLFIPVVGLLAPIFVELILIDDWSLSHYYNISLRKGWRLYAFTCHLLFPPACYISFTN